MRQGRTEGWFMYIVPTDKGYAKQGWSRLGVTHNATMRTLDVGLHVN